MALPYFDRLKSASLRIEDNSLIPALKQFTSSMGPRLVKLDLEFKKALPMSFIVEIQSTCTNLEELYISRPSTIEELAEYPKNSGVFRYAFV